MAQWHRNIQDIITIIDDCIRAQQDEALTLRALAQKLGYSEYYTSRKFRELAGMTLRDYLRLRRLAFALRDVRDTDAGILDIAVQYGFSSNEAFTHAFKKAYGVSPSAYRAAPGPIVLQTILRPFDCYLMEGANHMNETQNAGEVQTYFVHIPAHKFLHIRNYESIGYWDFWQRQAQIPGQDCETICGLLASIPGKLDDAGGTGEDAGSGQLMAWINEPTGRICSWGIPLAEAYGVLLYCNTFTPSEVRIITENPEFAARLPKLFHKAFSLRFDQMPESDGRGKLIFRITRQEKLRRIVDLLGYDPSLVLHVNFGLLEDECCRTAFMRGAFLAGGSVTDPEKRYHLELATSHMQASREVSALLTEMGFVPHSVRRSGSSVIYFKQSEHIEDLLTTIGAPAAAMDIMTAKVDKEIRNGANRAMNCDMANVNKTVDAALEQTAAISRLAESGRLALLPEKLRQAAQLRLDNPEMSLQQLAERSDPPVSKSCMNHRMRRLMEEARESHE